MREKFIKSHLQQVNVRIRSDIKRKKKEDEGGLLQLGVQITRGGGPTVTPGIGSDRGFGCAVFEKVTESNKKEKETGHSDNPIRV